MKELILEIMKTALEKNQENKNTIFIDYSGHVQLLNIQVYLNGWKDYKQANYTKDLYMSIHPEKENIEELSKILEFLKGLED
jgi:outer membrane protein assembly factor BamD (BamD/ComL family)